MHERRAQLSATVQDCRHALGHDSNTHLPWDDFVDQLVLQLVQQPTTHTSITNALYVALSAGSDFHTVEVFLKDKRPTYFAAIDRQQPRSPENQWKPNG